MLLTLILLKHAFLYYLNMHPEAVIEMIPENLKKQFKVACVVEIKLFLYGLILL